MGDLATVNEFAAEMAAAFVEGTTPPELQAQFRDFADRHSGILAACRARALAAITDTRDELPADATVEGLRFIASELIDAAVTAARVLKHAKGETFSPARFAVVAYDIARHSLDAKPGPEDPANILTFIEMMMGAVRDPDSDEAKAFVASLPEKAVAGSTSWTGSTP